jgi:hypothetical protein
VITVYSRPYIRAYGNDVQAGFGFYSGDTCENGTGDITAYGRDASASYAGSGGQFGAFARGQIRGFRTASTLSSAASEPSILSFANSALVAQATGRYGGAFGTGTCAYNYWSDNGRTTTINNQVIDIGTLTDGKYYVKQANASTPVVVTGAIANGVKVSLYVDGTAFVRGTSVGYAATNWTTASTIPSFYLIAHGNILIGSDVTSMDGNYIAQNTGAADGRITTCADPTSLQLYATNATQLTNCNKKLVVNGSFTAKHVNFLRLIGTIRQAVPGEASATTNAAETFIYPLENYLGGQAIGGVYQQTYDSITALPPIL